MKRLIFFVVFLAACGKYVKTDTFYPLPKEVTVHRMNDRMLKGKCGEGNVACAELYEHQGVCYIYMRWWGSLSDFFHELSHCAGHDEKVAEIQEGL